MAWYWQYPEGPLQYLLQSKGQGSSYSHTAPFARRRFSCQAAKSLGTLIISRLELEDTKLLLHPPWTTVRDWNVPEQPILMAIL